MLLILAGVTIAALTGSDSAPTKANEASQKNDIGTAKDDVVLTAVNAQNTAYETAYVENGVAAGNASNLVGKTVVKALYDKYGASTEIGKATVSIEVGGSADASNVNAITSGDITISTTDFELTGEVAISGGVITWGEIEELTPGLKLKTTSLTLAPGESKTIKYKVIGLSESVTWTSDNEKVSVANGVVSVDEEAEEGTAKITATIGEYTQNCTVTIREAVIPPVLVSESNDLITVNVISFGSLKEYDKLPSTKNLKAIKNSGQTNEQQIIVPAGFIVVEGKKLEDGMVIQDATTKTVEVNGVEIVQPSDTSGSQFVWIPVGQELTLTATYVNSNKSTSEEKISGKGNVELSRYVFNGANLVAKNPGDKISSYYTETANETVARTVIINETKEIEFVKKAIDNKGFYIGRYEAGLSGTTDNNSLSTKTAVNGTVKPMIIAGRGVWNYVSRDEAKTVSEAMYNNDTKFKSELMTSYAWDTAVVFIIKCGTNFNYENVSSPTWSKNLTGNTIIGNNYDVQCNIYDMACNMEEWTTEKSTYSGEPWVLRGGTCGNIRFSVINRADTGSGSEYRNYCNGFRPILYIM